MTTFKHNARKPHNIVDEYRLLHNPLAPRHHQQRAIRLRKIKLWANDPKFRPKTLVSLVGGVNVDALTFARANMLRDQHDLTLSEFVAMAVAAYSKMLIKRSPIECDDPVTEAWLNGTDEA